MELKDPLTLPIIPEYFVDRFGIRNVELWSQHFESSSAAYLSDVKKALKKSKCTLIDIQAEGEFDVSDPDDGNRIKGINEMKEWIDICAILGSRYIRIRSMNKSYQKSLESLSVLNEYAQSKGIRILIENHFDLFSNPDNHVNIFKDLGDTNVGLLADFGNYKEGIDRYAALTMIAPFTALVSAKTTEFTGNLSHTSYDYGRCVDIFESAGYQGIYSLEQWGRPNPEYDLEKITDWMITEVKEHIRS